MNARKGDPNSPHYWLRPIELAELKTLIENVRHAHEQGLGFASITLNRIEIALDQLQERMEEESR